MGQKEGLQVGSLEITKHQKSSKNKSNFMMHVMAITDV